ncbi:hypothetical protein LCGC14_2179540, partial [marine sediment metagenome]
MGLLEIVDFLGFIFILVAAFLISSKYVTNPKVRMVAFTSYFIACFFLIAWGWMASGNLITWFTLQQTVLIFINIRGIMNAYKDIKLDGDNRFEGDRMVEQLPFGVDGIQSAHSPEVQDATDSKPSLTKAEQTIFDEVVRKVEGEKDRIGENLQVQNRKPNGDSNSK